MDITFKTRNKKQLLAARYWIDSDVEEILYGGAKGGGKSYLGAVLIFADALIYPETHYFIARKELIDLRNFTIPTIHEVFRNWGLDIEKYAKYNGQDHCFNLYNGSKVFLIACKDLPSDPLFERFGSMQMTRGWIEEGGEVPEDAKSNLWLSIGRWKNEEHELKKKLLITANPKKGWMKRDFIDLFSQKKLPKTRKYVQAFATDNVYLPADYLESLKNEKNKVRRQRLWEGNWDYDDDLDSLITYDALSDAFSNTIEKDGEKYLTVDVARKGRDKTAFSFWDGLELYKIETFRRQSLEKTKQQARDFAAVEKIPYSHVLFDEEGVGGALVDGMLGVNGFVGSSTPIRTANQIRMRQARVEHSLVPKTTFLNLRAQCGWKLSELINDHGIAFRVPEFREEIMEDLSALLRDHDIHSEGKKQLRKKKDVKEEIDRSPDVGDTILMRAWFELKREALQDDPAKNKHIAEEQEVRFSRAKRNQPKNSTK